MSAPSIEKMVEALDDIQRIVAEIETEYRWFYPVAYEPAVTDIIRQRTYFRPAEDDDEESGSDGISRPVEAIAASKNYVRLQVQLASKLVLQAKAAALGARAALARAASDQDTETAEHTPAEFNDTAPRLISRSELEAARAAKDRRTARGEGYGVG